MSEIVLISRPEINLKALKKCMSLACQETITKSIDQCQVTLSPAAEFLIYSSYLYIGSLCDPMHILKNLPLECMKSLHYSFLIGCHYDVAFELSTKTSLQIFGKHVGNEYLMLVTGPLDEWYKAITANSFDYELLNNIRRKLESEGLKLIFKKV